MTKEQFVGTNAAAARKKMRETLLQPTLQHAAANVPAYAAMLSGFATEIASLKDLPRAPIVTKEDMLRDLDSFRDASLATAAIQHTGGTTRNTLLLHRSTEEIAFIREFFMTVNASGNGSGGRMPFVVSLLGHFHGDATPVPYPGRVLDLRISDPYWNVEQIVTEPWKLYGESEAPVVLVGLESQLRILTCRLTESGFDFGHSRVVSLHSTGDLITRRLSRWYSSTWCVPITTRYSMTEIFGGANPCDACGDFHFDPIVIGEGVDPLSREPVNEGYAGLVVTALYPFVQKQPVIRYWTGDLVKISRGCRIDDFGFAFQGRLFRSVVVPGEGRAEVLMAAAEAYDLIDDFSAVASSEMFPHVTDVRDHSVLGHLKFRILFEDPHLRVEVETRFSPYAYVDATAELLQQLRDGLLARHPDLRARVARGTIALDVAAVPPGTLRSSFMPDESE